ncbi:MAG: hypothetical protein DCC75_11575 [Proteobacteria bacterium]|nr:MAG: hypothetical protein DCC75_11575 [Pseudomonadota bacterium]
MENCPRRKNSYAATLIEAAIGSIVFLIVLMGFIDFARVIAIKSTLSRAAGEALLRAAVERDLEITTNQLADRDDWQRFIQARNRVEQSALGPLLNSFVSLPAHDSSAQLIDFHCPYQVADSADFAASAQNYRSTVVLLRPGEQAQAVDSSYSLSNPEVMSEGLANSTNMSELLREIPMVVEVRSKVTMLTPFLGELHLTGRSVGFKEQASPFSAPEAVPLGDIFLTPQPQFTATPTPDPFAATPTPTATPDPAATSTPTPTPAPTCPSSAFFACAATYQVPDPNNNCVCVDGAANG